MASLTDARHKMQGKTVLYIPNENNNFTEEQAAKSKDYVQRLEGQSAYIRYVSYTIKWN